MGKRRGPYRKNSRAPKEIHQYLRKHLDIPSKVIGRWIDRGKSQTSRILHRQTSCPAKVRKRLDKLVFIMKILEENRQRLIDAGLE